MGVIGNGLFWMGFGVGATFGLLLVWLCERLLRKHLENRQAFLSSISDEADAEEVAAHKKWVS